MKKKILLPVLLVVIAAILLIFYLKKETCTPLKLKRINVSGNAQFVIGKSIDQKSILLTNLTFDKNDSVHSDIIALNGMVLGPGFNYGNYINDTVMLVFNLNYKPFVFNIKSKEILPYKSQLKFDGIGLDDIQIVKFKGEIGIVLNEKNNIVFENVKTGKISKLFDPKQLNNNDVSLVSFDVFNDKIITCFKTKAGNTEQINYDFFLTDGDKSEKIYSLTDIKPKNNDPKVKFIDKEKYLISYLDGKSFIRINNISSSSSTSFWCIDNAEILSTEYVNKTIYVTLKKSTGEKYLLNNNPYKILYSGVNVYQVINPIK